ncbi:hypothetical protein BJ973_004030 [Actinoplanes tereljensis]|uniref:Uncharacterized protein n=1 Tax=Paractinoplanes tereljensis TaxID=571912 RepID=A0A919NUZ8_9ACTN|nr:hypothetical protein [Actinoplanes tereljensis]GIF25756.1 hypothetical protein Ate02nite_84860 [Actinoplanes tereljensis]
MRERRITAVVVIVALVAALVGNLLTNTVNVAGPGWQIGLLGALLVLAAVLVLAEWRRAQAQRAPADEGDRCSCVVPQTPVPSPFRAAPWWSRGVAGLETRRYQISPKRVQKVFAGAGWEGTLRSLYPNHPPISLAGVSFPVWAEVAAPELRSKNLDLDAAIGDLHGEVPRVDRYDAEDLGFDPRGRAEFRHTYWRRDERRRFNAETFALERIVRRGPGDFLVDARYGRYFQSVATSEMLEREFIDAVSRRPGAVLPMSAFPRREWLREQTNGNEIFDGSNRSAALSVAAAVIVREERGYSALLSRRSSEVKTHPGFQHVFPSGILAPTSSRYAAPKGEYSVKRAFLREFAEELFRYDELTHDSQDLRDAIRGIWPIEHMLDATVPGPNGEPPVVEIRYAGISVPLLTLRPELYVVLLVRERGWFDDMVDRSRRNCARHGFNLNWEFEDGRENVHGRRLDSIRIELDDRLELIDRRQITPLNTVPHAAAALWLGTQVARDLVQSADLQP